VLVAVALVPAGAARAQSAWQSRAAVTFDARGEIGTGDVTGIHLGALGAGVEWRLVPTLRLRTVALVLGGTGSTDTGRSAGGGAGGELAARLVPFPAWPVQPYLRLSAGLLLFLREPFLPGGDFYDFIIGMGTGLAVPIGPRLTVTGDLHVTHLSNGQGLGPFNPAFDGWGGLLSINYALAPEPEAGTSAADNLPLSETENPRAGWTPGIVADAVAGHADVTVTGGHVRLAERIAPPFLATLDAQTLSFDGVFYEDVGLGVVAHWPAATAGVLAAYEHLTGISALAEQAQIEVHLSPETSLFGTGIWQQTSVFADSVIGGFGLRMFPIPKVRIDGGVGLTRILGGEARTTSAPYWSFEWQLPVGEHAWQVSIFAEHQLSMIKLAGVRLAWNMGGTLRDAARRTGWARIR